MHVCLLLLLLLPAPLPPLPPLPAPAPPPGIAPGTTPGTTPGGGAIGAAPPPADTAPHTDATDTPRPAVKPSALVRRIVDDPLTTDAQRTELRIFHGLWDELGDGLSQKPELTRDQRAAWALMRYQLGDPTLTDPATDPHLRANAALKRGEPEQVAAILNNTPTLRAGVLQAQAYEDLGQLPDAIAQLTHAQALIDDHASIAADPAEITALAQSLAMLARLEGRPAHDYHRVMTLLGRIYAQVDPLYWPARLTEAQLLAQKGNRPEAVKALSEALSLNPHAPNAWHQLGQISIDSFDFAKAQTIAAKLRTDNPDHLLADLIDARSYLQQKDPASAQAVLGPALTRYPHHRELLSLSAAATALSDDEPATEAALARFDALSPGPPGSPIALTTVGQALATARQYAWGQRILRRAIARAPGQVEPRVALGLLLMQQGDLPAAAQALEQACALDPFHLGANNQLALVRQMLGYPTLETKHFIIRCAPGPDQALARDMARQLEAMYDKTTRRFQHAPAQKTQIDLLPDTEHFAVRITGHPSLWTIAACTGDVVAMAPPKTGPKQHGPYNWFNVLGHEYTHTVTLSQTRNRLPHWLTEACAVSMETTGRTWDQHQLLAQAVRDDQLFELDQINWAFIRPTTPQQRPLAYAQAAWMLDYLTETYGHDTLIDLLDRYRTDTTDTHAIAQATGVSAQTFFADFKTWAREQVALWGLNAPPDGVLNDPALASLLAGRSDPPDPDTLQGLIDRHPHTPGLLKLAADQALTAGDWDTAQTLIQRYGLAVPVDPWIPTAQLALAVGQENIPDAIAALTTLDRIDADNPAHALRLARLYRTEHELDKAQAATERALHREPYNPAFRELAAAIALERGDTPLALEFVETLALLEPDRPIHQQRLAALYQRLNRPQDAAAAARAAQAMNHPATGVTPDK